MTDEDSKLELTRRKILGAAGTVGVAGAGAGLGTSALFSDNESYTNNTIQAGELDMIVDASVPADGINPEWAGAVGFEEGDYDETADGEPAMGVTLGDMKPGDWVILCYDIEVQTNPACLGLSVPKESTANDENSVTEPEADAETEMSGDLDNPNTSVDGDADIDGEGELAQSLEVTVYDDLNPGDLDGTLSGAESALSNELLGGVTLNEVWSTFDGGGAIAADTRSFDFYLLLQLPSEVGNEVQSDSVAWDFVFDAVQSRNNECEEPVWGADAFSISASPGSAGETDSSHRIEVPVGSDLDGETLSTLTVEYPDEFGISDVGSDDVLDAGVQRTDSTSTSLPVTGVNTGSIEFILGGDVSVSTGDTIFIEYGGVMNPTTPGDYTIVVDVNGSEIGPGTLTITPDTGIVLEQNGTKLACVEPIEATRSVEEYYDYDDGNFDSSDTPDDLETEDATITFLYRNTDNDNLSLVVINGDSETEDGGDNNKAILKFDGVNDFRWKVQDGENDVTNPTGDFDDYSGKEVGDKLEDGDTAGWGWNDKRTDGGAFGFLGDSFDITITHLDSGPRFDGTTDRIGLDSWLFIDGSDPSNPIELADFTGTESGDDVSTRIFTGVCPESE